jgi:subtilase family serine protease
MRFLKFLPPLLAATLCFAAQQDRITAPIDSSQRVTLRKTLHHKAQPQYDLGVADPALELSYITLLMAPSPSQQKDLDQLLEQQQDRSSPLYHQWLTPQQFGDRFGLSQNDLNKVTAWLTSEGFQILGIGGGHNSVIFSGTAAQVQHAFGTEIHNYRVNGEAHIANSTPVMIPAALNGIVRSVMGLHDFRPQPSYRARGAGARRGGHPDYFDGNFLWPNFLAPGDIATIYNITPLYTASTAIDGTGQKLAIAGQTDIFLDDINDFRNGFGLNPIPTTGAGACKTNASGIVISPCTTTNFSYVLLGTDPLSVSSNDIGEADLDIEWSGAVARNAQIIFINGQTNNGVFDAMTAAINPPSGPPLATVLSASYGAGCEAQATGAIDLETVFQQGNAEGVTIMNSSGDVGAATCDFTPPNFTPPFSPAVGGLGVSYPASSPQVTAVGGTEITIADDANPPNPAFWGTTIGPNGGTAVTYIPEIAWNDDEALGTFCASNPGQSFCHPSPGVAITSAQTFQEDYWLSSSGGGASNCWYTTNLGVCQGPGPGPTTGGGFAQPTYQQKLSVPGAPAGVRYVPDVSLFASPSFPGYIFCTPLNPPNDGSTCASGIFTAVDSNFSLVGGTSVSSPVFAGIMALLNQYVVATGFQSTAGLGNVNPTLYDLAAKPSNGVFHTVTSGDNNVYCKPNTPAGQPSNVQCPAAGVMGYSASNFDATTHYNLVTGLGSVNVDNLFIAWTASAAPTTTTISTTSSTVSQGTSVTFTATVTPSTATGTVSFYNNGSTTALGSGTLSSGTATFTTSTLPVGSDSVTATYNGDPNDGVSTSAIPAVVTVTAPWSMSASPSSISVSAGQSAVWTLTLTPASGFTGSVSFTNSTASNPGSCTAGLPAGALCTFSQASVTLNGSTPSTLTLTITTAANMTVPSGAQVITITGTSGSNSVTATVNLTVTATNETFSLATTSGASTFPVTVGSNASVSITVSGTNGFIVGSGAGATTALALTYSCTGSPSLATSEISCQISPGNGQATNATAVTVNLVTTAPTAQLRPPLGGSRIFYALLLPGLFGVVLLTGSRTRGLRLLSLVVVLGFSTLWLGSCSGGSTNTNPKNPGTPKGTYTVTVGATTGGASPVTNSNVPFTFQLVVN